MNIELTVRATEIPSSFEKDDLDPMRGLPPIPLEMLPNGVPPEGIVGLAINARYSANAAVSYNGTPFTPLVAFGKEIVHVSLAVMSGAMNSGHLNFAGQIFTHYLIDDGLLNAVRRAALDMLYPEEQAIEVEIFLFNDMIIVAARDFNDRVQAVWTAAGKPATLAAEETSHILHMITPEPETAHARLADAARRRMHLETALSLLEENIQTCIDQDVTFRLA